eukprot:Nitzschia sp. Nitz4//scaffold3_size479765//333140//334307//NITZ4_000138-RA/size479765-augustus-gene-1.576-mRNA-1//1//CDS//3329550872//2131//frame0
MVSPFQPHWDLYPLTYVAAKVPTPLIESLDGDITKPVWQGVPWSEPFDDIRGPSHAPPDARPNANCTTRFKALWDDDHLYIGALIQTDFETIAEFTERNSPIFQKDSDFEVFIDPIGSCHAYKELEINAINTIWNLMLDKPYGDGGTEHSGRVAKPGDDRFYEVYNQRTAVRLLEGELNVPYQGTKWSLEIAISYKDVMAFVDNGPVPPRVGTMWRINFSRVELQGDINWTWQPQIAWNPKTRKFSGFVNMHLPDSWGYIVFGNEGPVAQQFAKDSSWPARLAAMNMYYAQKHFFQANGNYSCQKRLLSDFWDEDIVEPFVTTVVCPEENTYVVGVIDFTYGHRVTITQDRHILVSDLDASPETISF